ncbi:MAG: DUF2786 domain-containing protein [Chlamydiales bacterium]|nr:DUF2786 domain-containing protein [Chlamydiales bacterium]
MIVYSNKIIQFINEIKCIAKDILSKEIRLKVMGERFYDEPQQTSYPIKIVIYNNKSMLGYFDSDFYELGFHEHLMHVSKQKLYNVLRHELAHYMTFINHGDVIQPHGVEFKTFCGSMNWNEEVCRATICLDEAEHVPDIKESVVLRKIQKLLALTSSSNKNEAELAMIKSQQLLLKHNIDSKYIASEDDERMVLKRIMKQKREDAKMRAIAKILGTFFVSTVYNRAGDYIYLEILGSAVNIEIADYVAATLQHELDKLWDVAQQHVNLRGITARNSFFLGIATGYCNKIQALKREYQPDIVQALMVIENQLTDAREMVYKRLSTSRSHAKHCRESSMLGERMGRELNINTAISKSSTLRLV